MDSTDQTDNVSEGREPFDIQDPSETRRAAIDAHSDSENAAEPDAEADDNSGVVDQESDGKDAVGDTNSQPNLGDISNYLDSDLAKVVQEQFSKMSEEIRSLKSQISERGPRLRMKAGDIFKGHEALFGSDDPSPEQQRNRDLARDQVDILKAGYKAAGKKAPSTQELIDKVVRSEFADELRNRALAKQAPRFQNRQQQIVSRPDGRNGHAVSARERATQAVERRLRELGQ